MNHSSPARRIRLALLILCSFGSLGLSVSTGNWYIFGAWLLVCVLAFPLCFIITLYTRKAPIKGEGADENSG